MTFFDFPDVDRASFNPCFLGMGAFTEW